MHSEKSEFGTFSVAAEAAAAVHTRWASGSPPSIAEVLSPQVLSDDDCLAETLAADAEERRRRTLPGQLEEYLAVAPQIRERPGVCRAVLMVEVVARAAESEEALRTDLMARFPSLAAEVDAVVGLASLFRSAAEDARPATGAHVPGETIGKYRIHRWLGEGAFGEVWQAWDVDLERYVALKILRATHHSGIRGQRIFLAETRAAAALDHESVVRIHAAGRFAETGEYYIDAQLVGEAAPTPDDPRGMQPGRTLEQRLRTGPIPPREAAALLAAAARGVAAAHARGITHRDIKPSNILVSGAGRPLVSDFGLSLSDSGAAARPMPEPAARPGAPGGFARLAGTPAYMAPEQAGGLIATPLSDVFSLGATLRALLSGRPPYLPDPDRAEGSREQVIAMARLGKLSPLQSICPGVPRTLAAICDRATSRSPGDRYPSAERLAADLEAFLGQRPTLADPPSTVRAAWMWCRRHSMTSLVGLAAGVLVIGATTAFVVRLTVERDRAVAAEIESQKQRDAAVDARQTVETINAFFARTFSSARGLEESDDIGVIDAIRLASGRAGRMFGDRPIVEAGVRHFLGQSAMGAKSLETAEQELRRAWDLRRALLGVHAPDTLATRRQMADLLMLQRKFGEAETVFREILGPLQQSVGEDSPDALRALAFLGNQERVRGNPGAARDMLERATAGYRRITQHGAADRQQALNWLVLAYVELKRLDLAERAQREIVAMNEADLGPDDVSTLNAAQALGWVLRLEKNDDEAEAIFRATLARYSEIVSPNHLGMLHVAVELAGTIISRSPAEAADLARRVIAGAETHAEGNLTQLRGLVTLGRALVLQNLDQEAEPVLRRSLDLGVKHRGADHQLTRDSARLLIGVLERQSRSADADEVRRRVPLEATPER